MARWLFRQRDRTQRGPFSSVFFFYTVPHSITTPSVAFLEIIGLVSLSAARNVTNGIGSDKYPASVLSVRKGKPAKSEHRRQTAKEILNQIKVR